MSLTAFAVVSQQGTPLYLRDYATNSNLLFNLYGDDDDSDMFGDGIITVEETTMKQKETWPCQLQYQFILHSACQRLEDVLRGNSNQWKAPGASGMDACWVGLLCLSDNLRAYGYVTTNVRYVTLVEDSIAPENVQLQTSRDNEICVLMANVHRLYTETLLNPFTTLHSKITSKRFDSSVTTLVYGLNGC
mmetsp:Transcript_15266/g.27751  ORF Transcript_15266/g.27751 Transcript_15266/m.27751 type:complete len:190 (-) Transcript_15266:319-888(-)|eukprot:CAMPEP_0201888602 /NCGR_PEP_ID=MMETSP0902-20130614/28030_1 /ASSEMBLY_ACC=CAM_ASM_000551 /TAXON_ID=420261 /ORGANISM="Thalassiosira antarctica, Strain CCMP982" /LENGTH=189 /DNA_ID=CAMNT_0048418899 /DNA_START=30 /DNA_END=599 /DNA_ORIENTATION=+